MAVVAASGAVGIVMNVMPNVSQVLLITDPNSSTDVIVSRNRKRGVLQGTATNFMQLKHVGKGSKIQVGDQILTSGLTSAFPRGISVGRVVNIQVESDNVSQRVEVEPVADFSDLSEVLVLRRPSPELDIISEIGGQEWMDKVLHTGTKGGL
jgi:rod shape-determining protein MreC